MVYGGILSGSSQSYEWQTQLSHPCVDGRSELPRDLQTYLRTHTYIDAREYDLKTLRKRIRLSMPDVPLAQLRQAHNENQVGPVEENGIEDHGAAARAQPNEQVTV